MFFDNFLIVILCARDYNITFRRASRCCLSSLVSRCNVLLCIVCIVYLLFCI